MLNIKQTTPEQIKNDDNNLLITWKDAHDSIWNLIQLRKNCPCAVCRGGDFGKIGTKTKHITEASIVEFKKVGRYAINIIWADTHATGIHTYDNLRDTCECAKCQK